jgi:protein SCO1
MRPANDPGTRWVRSLATATSLVTLLALVGFGGTDHARPPLHGLVPTPLPVKPDFTLTTTGGRPFRFTAGTRGKLAYLYFGYTHCPDTCPTTMSDIAAALQRVPAAVRRRVEVVFVTVDPRRDTKRVLRAWLNHFNHAFVGLTGNEREIHAAEQAAGVPVAPPDMKRGSNYAVQHSSLLIPYSPDNRAHVVYTQGFHTNDYIHDMPVLLSY